MSEQLKPCLSEIDARGNGYRLFKFIQKCNRHRNKADLHSFTNGIDGGRAFVECRGSEVFVEAQTGEK